MSGKGGNYRGAKRQGLLPDGAAGRDNSGRPFPSRPMSRCVALIPAAGTGSRIGNQRPKQYLPLLGRPMLAHAVAVLAGHARIERVYLVLSRDDAWFDRFDWSAFAPKLDVLHVGGPARAESVANGLEAMEGEVGNEDWVLVHDAARPCLTSTLLDRLIGAVEHDAVGGLLAVRVADTLKRGDADARIVATELREGLWQAQTPQMFRRGVLVRALAAIDPALATDEAYAVERSGAKPMLVESSVMNLKVTFPEDLEFAEAILRYRQAD